MKKKTVVYKVVLVNNDKLVSALTSGLYMITYIPRKIIKPDIGGIFASDTITNAHFFFSNLPNLVEKYQIWEARTSHCAYLSARAIIPENFPCFWKEFDFVTYTTTFSPRNPTPIGTLICNDLTLIKRIE